MSGEIQSGTPWVGGAQPIIGDGWVQFEGPASPKISFDELSPSQQQAVAEYVFLMQFPVLTPPAEFNAGGNQIGGLDAGRALLALSNTQHEIVSGMLDKWLDTIKELNAQRIRNDERHQEERHHLNVQLDSLASINRVFHATPEIEKEPAFEGFTLGIIVTGMGVTEAIMPDPGGRVAVNPIQDVSNRTMAPLAPEFTMTMPIFCMCVIYNTTVQELPEAGKGEPPKDLDFAKKYGKNMLALVENPAMNAFLMNLITAGVAKGEPVSKERMQQLMAGLKTVLLATALAMVYIAEFGKMTGIEFKDMLQGKLTFPEGDIRNKIVQEMNKYLNLMAPEEREALIEQLSDFFDENPSVELLANPTKVFGKLNMRLPRGSLQA